MYARARDYRSLKQSSFDPTGGNRDFWAIPAGGVHEVFRAEGPGVITHIWFTIAARSNCLAPLAKLFGSAPLSSFDCIVVLGLSLAPVTLIEIGKLGAAAFRVWRSSPGSRDPVMA